MEYDKVGITLTCEFDYSLPSASFHANLIQYDVNQTELNRTSVSCFINSFYTPSLSLTTVEGCSYVSLMLVVYGESNTVLYVDNAKLYENQ